MSFRSHLVFCIGVFILSNMGSFRAAVNLH